MIPDRNRTAPLRDGQRNRKAIVLITVLGSIAMVMMLFVAMFSLSNSEYAGATAEAATKRANAFADIAKNIVISQIRRATAEPKTTWASQPGAIRTYAETGPFRTGLKLYSDSRMAVTAERLLSEDAPPSIWNSEKNRARYTDLNSPILRHSDDEWIFPIADPRALSEVEGFAYDLSVVGGPAKGGHPTLPMPVEWIYILKDSTVGTLDDSGEFVGRNPATPENPIVGRIAFWTDEETSKININTASEPTFWDKPRTAGEDDRQYDKYQPANREYQRYPGHPATTALSPVLSPGRNLTPDEKETIYEIVPRISPGGSRGATVSYREDPNVPPDIITDGDRLFASLDEFLLPPGREWTSSTENPILSPDRLRRSRFFLTAHSRAPEVTLFGTPRIAVWPLEAAVWYNSKARSGHDLLIAYCATLGDRDPRVDVTLDVTSDQREDYFYRRLDIDTPNTDLHILRNLQLQNYLEDLTSRNIPGFGGTFRTKYGPDCGMIVSEIFGYIGSKRSYYYINGSPDAGGPTYFSPNRQVAGPAMLGVLPSGVISRDYGRTLLFRREDGHFGARHPQDHLLLDLFWMPVVEPYAISEPFSTAGKVNMNHQILPFKHILRTTALRGIFGDERILVNKIDAKDPNTDTERRRINANETLKQWAYRFQTGKLFKSASEICDLHLVPEGSSLRSMFSKTQPDSSTGEKVVERSYQNLHARLTTQSNIFRIHLRAEAITKARSSPPDTFDPDRDSIVATYRGSTLIERYLDPADERIPNYAPDQPERGSLLPPPKLETFYRFRIIGERRFE